MLEASRQEILVTSEGVRLQGYTSKRNGRAHRGLAILLPGWEGSANSTYVVCLGRILHKAGYSVYRLNYRDHGHTHHLNEGMFHGALLDEVAEVVTKVATREREGPVFVVGFSLGGNFALRLARLKIPRLCQVFAVSPVLDPLASTRTLDAHPLFRNYFREKWVYSLQRKEALFPQRYNFTELYDEPSIMAMTKLLLDRYTTFPTVKAYFDQYTLTPERLANVKVPVFLIAALEDPVVADWPYSDYYRLEKVCLSIQRRGGHIGFLGPFLRTSWYEKVILELMLDQTQDG